MKGKALHWKVKAAAFKVLDVVPFGNGAHYLLQRHFTRTWPRPNHILDSFLRSAREIRELVAQNSEVKVEDARFLEIGAGRDLAMPLALRMLGARQVTAVDIDRLAKLDLVNHSASYLAAQLKLPVPIFSAWNDVEAFGISYLAPYNVAKQIPVKPFDVFISNEVLEHIPLEPLKEIFTNVNRILAHGGLSLHSIDYSDHYARDGGVSRHNFLTYSDRYWRLYNSEFHYVNRLRHKDYIDIHARGGLDIIDVTVGEEPVDDRILDNLDEKFRGFSADELRIVRGRILSKLK